LTEKYSNTIATYIYVFLDTFNATLNWRHVVELHNTEKRYVLWCDVQHRSFTCVQFMVQCWAAHFICCVSHHSEI